MRREGEEQEAEYDIDELDARLVSYAHALKHQSFAPHPDDYDLSKVARYQEFLGHVRSSSVCQAMSNYLLLHINYGLVYNFICILERRLRYIYKVQRSNKLNYIIIHFVFNSTFPAVHSYFIFYINLRVQLADVGDNLRLFRKVYPLPHLITTGA